VATISAAEALRRSSAAFTAGVCRNRRTNRKIAAIAAAAASQRRWLAVAAAIAAIFLFVRLFRQTPAVKAAELLRKASAAEKVAPARPRTIRIQSRKYKWDRPARLAPGAEANSTDASAIRQLLESAGYSWENPLSAGAYARWHDSLAQKQDRVEGGAQGLVLHTVTTANAISDASLTLAGDLHAMACTLRFGAADVVEMAEIPEPAEPAVIASPRPSATPQPVPASSEPPMTARPVGPADELAVLAALHKIGADLGEPIDVRREGAEVLVNVTGVAPQRQAQVKNALAGLAAVRLQFGRFEHRESRDLVRRPATQVDAANPLLEELQAASPATVTTAELSDQMTANTDKLIERAYALRGLARRFPAEVTAQMTAADTATLNSIVRDHFAVVASSAAAIHRLLAPIVPDATSTAQSPGLWQEITEALLADARSLDQALNDPRGSDDIAQRKLRAAQSLADLDRRLARLRGLVL